MCAPRKSAMIYAKIRKSDHTYQLFDLLPLQCNDEEEGMKVIVLNRMGSIKRKSILTQVKYNEFLFLL